MKEIITARHSKFAQECRKATENWPERHLTAEDMRDQVKRNHEAVLAEEEKDLSLPKK